jgi:hypothetical protein
MWSSRGKFVSIVNGEQMSVDVDRLAVPGAAVEVLPVSRCALVIHPEASGRSMVEVALARDGVEVRSAASVRAGIAVLAHEAPEVIIVDERVGSAAARMLHAAIDRVAGHKGVPTIVTLSASRGSGVTVRKLLGAETVVRMPAFAKDIAALARFEMASAVNPREISFSVLELPPANLLRALLATERSGRMVLADGRAEVWFRSGAVDCIELDGVSHFGGLAEILLKTTVAYTVVIERLSATATPAFSGREVISDVLPQVLRRSHGDRGQLESEARLMVDLSRASRTMDTLPEEAAAVIRLFDGRKTVGQVQTAAPCDGALTLQITEKLYHSRLLIPAPLRHSVGAAMAVAPTLFPGLEDGVVRSDDASPDISEVTQFHPSDGKLTDSVGASDGWTIEPMGVIGLGIGARRPTPTELKARTSGLKATPPSRFKNRPLVDLPNVAPVVRPVAADDLKERAARVPLPTPSQFPELGATERTRDAELEAEFFGSKMSPMSEPLPASPPAAVQTPRRRRRERLLPIGGLIAVTLFVAVALDAVRKKSERPVRGELSLIEPILVEPILVEPILVEPILVETESAGPSTAVNGEVGSRAASAEIEEPTFLGSPLEPSADGEETPASRLDKARALYGSAQYGKAVSLLDRLVDDRPDMVDAWVLLGLARFDARDVAGARRAAEQVLELDPQNARIQVLLATLFFDAQDRAQGRAALERYLRLEPQGPFAVEARALLAR